MNTLILLFNHSMTGKQRALAQEQLGVERIIEPPPNISILWATIPPEADALVPVLAPVTRWLDSQAEQGDHVLIQGDFGACYLMVRHAFARGYVPVYSTTERRASEQHFDDGQVELTHRFQHVQFRKYGG